MAEMRLISALDFPKCKHSKTGQLSYQKGGKWYYQRYGNGYCNTYEVVSASNDEWEIIKKKEIVLGKDVAQAAIPRQGEGDTVKAS